MSSGKAVAGGSAGLLALAISIATPTITKWEGLRNLPYRDVAGYLTVCAGHTGPEIVIGKRYSDEECRAFTAADVEKHTDGVLRCSPHLLWHPMQLAATIVFAFNVGIGAYCNSSIRKAFDRGDFIAGCNALTLYNRAGGMVVQGLVNRRADEKLMCLSTLTPQAWWAFRKKLGLV